MPLRIYIGGVEEVPGDNVGLVLASQGESGLMEFACDAGERTAEVYTVNAPAGCEVSKDDVTYGASAVYPAGSIEDVKVPCYVKRTQAVVEATTWLLGMTVPLPHLVATEAIPAAQQPPAAFTPEVTGVTATGAVVAFGTTDINGDPITYRMKVTTSPTPPTTWNVADVTSPQNVTGLPPLTQHWAHVRASDGTDVTVGTSAPFTTASDADTTAPVIAGTLAATPTAVPGQVALSGPTATDTNGIGKWQRQTDGGAWVDVASTSATFPTTNVDGLSTGSHDFAVRALDPSGNPSATKTASATVGTPLLPYSQNFASAAVGATVNGVDGWEGVTSDLNTQKSTYVADTSTGSRMVKCSNNAPAASGATFATWLLRRVVDLSLATTLEVEYKFRVGTFGGNLLLNGGAFIVQVTGTTVDVWNGSAYVPIVSGLASGTTRTIKVKLKQGDTTVLLSVNGGAYISASVGSAIPASLTRIEFQMVAGTATLANAFVGDVVVRRP